MDRVALSSALFVMPVRSRRRLCYCSLPQTGQTDAHRLMRDLHRRQILNRLRHHKNEDANAVKTRIITFWSIASRQSTQDRAISTKGLYNRRNKELGHSRCGPGAKISA